MNKGVFVTNGNHPLQQLVVEYLLEKDFRVSMPFASQREADHYRASLSTHETESFYPVIGGQASVAEVQVLMDKAIEVMGGLHVLIHGIHAFDEDKEYGLDPVGCGTVVEELLRQAFLFSRIGGTYMARKMEGRILFPLLSDSLYYESYPVSPMINHGKMVMMKTLAKEMATFRVATNALTFGYYSDQESGLSGKELRKKLGIYALKPHVPQLDEMVPMLDILLGAPTNLISGQNLHIGAGLDTLM
jgi:3-oxoacyl-[acyl-carrier protein] reductase